MDSPASLSAGYRLTAYDCVDSTNERARQLAMEGAPDGTVVWAERQTAGRGRRGRQWQSPKGNLYCSVLVRPEMPAGQAAQFSFAAALALGDAVSGLVPENIELQYKWPNDLLLDGRKLAGILLESSGVAGGMLDWLVVGVGLNVAEFPEVTEGYPATSLREHGVDSISPQDILARYIAGFAHWRRQWQNEGLAALHDAWLYRAAMVGEQITVRLPDAEMQGRFEGLDDEGALLLRMADGTRRAIAAGDVFF
jgi:BirA family biotin operon repressor/biotin-[acetyl-CoA-carboxylase] ligase